MMTLTCSAALALLLTTAGTDDVLTPLHVARLRAVGAVEISPDGSLVAYGLNVPRKPWDESSGPSWEELRVVDRAGHARPFVTGEVNVSTIRFSKDGRSITYLGKRNGEKNASLYRIAVDGGESRKVLSYETSIA